MTEVMSQAPQPTPSPHGVATSMPPQSPQVQQQAVPGAGMTQVMPQAPQATPPHGVTTSMPPQSPQFYVQASVAPGMQAPPAIAPAPGPQTTTTTVSALHQPLQQHLAPQPLTHPGVPQSPMPQFQQPVQVIQGGIPSGPYLQQVYQNPQGQLIMSAGNLTLQTTPGMGGTQLLPGNNPLNSSIQVITAGKPFQGGITPHMLAAPGGKTGVLQTSGQTGCYNPSIPTSGNQTVLISQLAPLGVITSQPTNILPAHQTGPKPGGEMQKVGNVQTFGQMSTGITWAPSTLQPPALLTPQNQQQIFIRGTQPGQENVFIHNPQAAHTMTVPPNSMLPMAGGQQQQQQTKPRTGLETPNIQPKTATMRPTILPSTPQIRPGASVSTQTASGQMAQMGAPRTQVGWLQAKNRSKNASRGSPAIAAQPQQQQVAPSTQVLQPQTAVPSIPVSVAVAPAPVPGVQGTVPVTVLPVSTPGALVPNTVAATKAVTQASPLEAITNIAQAKPATTLHPIMTTPTASSPVRLPNNKLSSVSVATALAASYNAPSALTSVPAPAQLQTVPAPVPISSIIPSAAPITPSITTSVTQSISLSSTGPSSENKSIATPTSTPSVMQQSSTTTGSNATVQTLQVPIGQPQVQTVLPQQQPPPPPPPSQPQQSEPITSVAQAPHQLQPANKSTKLEIKSEVTPKKALPPTAAALSTTTGSHTSTVSAATPTATITTSTSVIASSAVATTLTSIVSGSTNGPQCNGIVPPPAKNNLVAASDATAMVNGVSHPQEKPLNTTVQTPTGPPKALVKPQVLTHVIEGFVIHEASEPFPVSRSSRMSDVGKVRNLSNTATVAPQANQATEKDADQDDGLVKKGDKSEYFTCEGCNKTDLRTKSKKSKRFCSNSCAKRFNVNVNKRGGHYQSPEDSPSKRMKEDNGEEAEASIGQEADMQFKVQDEMGASELPSLDNGIGELGDMNEGSPSRIPRIDILRWTVKDVVDFIKNLPGCQDYADDFAIQEIDGQALMLLKADHLMSAMSIKLGPALKICAKIEELRSDRKET